MHHHPILPQKSSSLPDASGRDRVLPSHPLVYHEPVLLHEVLQALRGCISVLDCTLGGGGHSEALLGAGSEVTGLDRDPSAIAAAAARLGSYARDGRFSAVSGDFTRLEEIAVLASARFDGILADLGVSSRQVDEAERGFSFRPGVALDMRMSGVGETAADYLNGAAENVLAEAFRSYGDEPRASRLAREVVRRRANRPFRTSDDLVGAIRGALGPRSGPSDFARLFQAVRIAVNDELAGLERALPELRERLTQGGVLAMIAYHSGEDRLVKHAMRDWSTVCRCPPRQLRCDCGGVALGTLVTRKAIVPGADELSRNPRSRSARLRVWRRAA